MKIIKTETQDKLNLTGFISHTDNKENIIVHIHGMAGDPYTNNWYSYFHDKFPKNNYAFLVGNHRGTGSITSFAKNNKPVNIGNAFELFEDSYYDIKAWVNLAFELGYKNIYLQAHSLGPSKVVYFMNNYDDIDKIKGLILISPVDMLGLVMSDAKSYNKLLSESKKLLSENKDNILLSNLVFEEYPMSAKSFF